MDMSNRIINLPIRDGSRIAVEIPEGYRLKRSGIVGSNDRTWSKYDGRWSSADASMKSLRVKDVWAAITPA